jgi:hypothetical protein
MDVAPTHKKHVSIIIRRSHSEVRLFFRGRSLSNRSTSSAHFPSGRDSSHLSAVVVATLSRDRDLLAWRKSELASKGSGTYLIARNIPGLPLIVQMIYQLHSPCGKHN